MKKPKLNKHDTMELVIMDGQIQIEICRENDSIYKKIPAFLSGLILKYGEERYRRGEYDRQRKIKEILGIR